VLTFLVGEVLIDGEMIMDPPEACIALEDATFGYRLFDQSLHAFVLSAVDNFHRSEFFRKRNSAKILHSAQRRIP
jgi:hypothetical protein